MCGFFGLLKFPSSMGVDVRAFHKAVNAIISRGPDDEGYAFASHGSREVSSCSGRMTPGELNYPDISTLYGKLDERFDLALGFRRLSIQDLSLRGHQPMRSKCGTYLMVFNGEVYNFVEIREQLIQLGHEFYGSSDSEVVLAAYVQWGGDAFAKFRGMWAVAISDLVNKKLVLSRDPFGIKPLYYSFSPYGLVFGSELKSFIASGFVDKKISKQGLYNYLTLGRPGIDSGSMIEGVFQLPAASYVEIDAGLDCNEEQFSPSSYWTGVPKETSQLSFSSAVEKVRETFINSVQLHLRSDVPVAVNLSGGIDSSATLGVAKSLAPKGAEIQAFSFVPDEEFLSEERWIDLAAQYNGVKVNKIRPNSDNLLEDLNKLVLMQDEPIGSISPYAQYCVFKGVQEAGIKVTLDGQGADEFLGGYAGYMGPRLAELMHGGSVYSASRLISGASGEYLSGVDGLIKAASIRCRDSEPAQNVANFPPWMDADFFGQDIIRPVSGRHLQDSMGIFKGDLYHSLVSSSLPELLRFADRNSMGHSVESRVPFLNNELVELAFSLPKEHIISADGLKKSVFREAMRGLVPNEILDRKDKIGFTVPEKHWLQGGQASFWVEEVLQSYAIESPFKKQALLEEWYLQKNGYKQYNPMPWRWVCLKVWADALGVEL